MLIVTLAFALGIGSSRLVADSCIARSAMAGMPVPVDYADGRFFARWPLYGGDTLRLYLDTGGPRDQLLSSTVTRLGLTREVLTFEGDSGSWVRIPGVIAHQIAPAIRSNTWLDTAQGVNDGSIRVMASFPGSVLDQLVGEGPAGARVDGILGPDWFAGRVWRLDYPGGRLFYHGAEAIGSIPPQCWIPLGFQTDSAGEPTTNFPRISAVIDGDTLDFLFDAGAMTTLTATARGLIDPAGAATRAASFLVHEWFERWHARHPDWLVVTDADQRFHNRMMRVPEIVVGGRRLGPVWFSERPDGAFHNFMSQWMDRRVDGALGGSAWRDVVIVLDYPRSRAAVLAAGGR